MGEKTKSTQVKSFDQRTDAAQSELLRGSDLINRVAMNQERLIHFTYFEEVSVGENVRLIDDGLSLVSVFAGVRRIGQVLDEDSKFLRAEVFTSQTLHLLARVTEVNPAFQLAGATLQNPL